MIQDIFTSQVKVAKRVFKIAFLQGSKPGGTSTAFHRAQLTQQKPIFNTLEKRAFTLIEILIYIGIVTTILTVTSILAIQVYQGYNKNVTYQSLQNNARFVMSRIIQDIEQADGINVSNSIFNQDNGKLSLLTSDPNTNPTIFQIESDTITITQGSQNRINLASTEIVTTQLRFENLSSAQTPGTIKTTLTLEYINLGNRPDQEASFTITSTTNLRKTP